jgi:hypothetical protein
MPSELLRNEEPPKLAFRLMSLLLFADAKTQIDAEDGNREKEKLG